MALNLRGEACRAPGSRRCIGVVATGRAGGDRVRRHVRLHPAPTAPGLRGPLADGLPPVYRVEPGQVGLTPVRHRLREHPRSQGGPLTGPNPTDRGKNRSKLHLISDHLRKWPRERGIVPRIARRGVESSARLGRHRWMVERTMSWLSGCRRLHRRYERKPEHFIGFTAIAVMLICLRRLGVSAGR